jgi:hypothetical protein
MHIVTGYTGENHITSADDASLHRAIFGEGDYVLDTGSKFKATIIDNNTIRIDDGDLLIQGHLARINPGEYEEVTIDNGTPDSMRYDLIVAKYLKDNVTGIESVTIEVIKGTAGTFPTEPDITQDNLKNGGLERDFVLYRVLVDGATLDSVEKRYKTVSAVRAEDGGIRINAGSGINAISSDSGSNLIDTYYGNNLIFTNRGSNTIQSVSGKIYIKTGSQTITFPDDFASGTWTPTLISTSGNLNQPVSSAEGRWFKTGSVITLQINIIIGSGTIHAGNIAIVNATAPADISPPSSVNAPVLVGRLMTNSNALGANSLKLPLHIGMMSNRTMFLYKPTGHLQGSDLAAGNMITITGSYSI